MDSADRGSSLKIDKLVGSSNWASWHFQLQLVLTSIGAWLLVSAATPKDAGATLDPASVPVPAARGEPTDRTVHSTGSTERSYVFSDEQKNKLNKAFAVIGLALDPSQQRHIMGCSGAREAYRKLLGIYQAQDAATKLVRRAALLALRQADGESVQVWLSRVGNEAAAVSAIGVAVPDEDVIGVVLNGLLPAYHNIRTFLLGSSTMFGRALALVDVERALIADETTQNASAMPGSTAFAAKGRRAGYNGDGAGAGAGNDDGIGIGEGDAERPPGEAKADDRCHHCTGFGHWQRDCPSKAAGHDRVSAAALLSSASALAPSVHNYDTTSYGPVCFSAVVTGAAMDLDMSSAPAVRTSSAMFSASLSGAVAQTWLAAPSFFGSVPVIRDAIDLATAFAGPASPLSSLKIGTAFSSPPLDLGPDHDPVAVPAPITARGLVPNSQDIVDHASALAAPASPSSSYLTNTATGFAADFGADVGMVAITALSPSNGREPMGVHHPSAWPPINFAFNLPIASSVAPGLLAEPVGDPLATASEHAALNPSGLAAKWEC